MNKDYDRDRDKLKKRKEFKLKYVEKQENISQRNKNKQTLREYINRNSDDRYEISDETFEWKIKYETCDLFEKYIINS